MSFLSWFYISSAVNTENQGVIYIENGGTCAGILAGVGGRIVYLSKDGSKNLLKSDSLLWNEDLSQRPEISPFTEWKTYNGHIVWNGPQSEWWIHQELNVERRKKRASWPPDPYLVFSKYKIVSRGKSSVTMESPESPISGLKLTKYVEIQEDGSLYFEVEGKNIRNSEISWDLWLNTRVDGFTKSYVKIDPLEKPKIKSNHDKISDTVNWQIHKGYFNYLPEDPPIDKEKRSSKAFLTPEDNNIHAFMKGHYFRIEFPYIQKEKVHGEHGLVEIYIFTSKNRNEALMELEVHSPFITLQPEQSMKTWQKWTIIPYKGKESMSNHLRFIHKNARNKSY